MEKTKDKTSFGIDPQTHHIVLGKVRVPLPRSKGWRIATGGALIGGGCLGFLPILGFWMVPLGFVVLSHDLAFVRRRRRTLMIWWGRRHQKRAGS